MTTNAELDQYRDEQNAKEHQQILEAIKDIKKNFVTKTEFLPVRLIAFGFVGIVVVYFLNVMLQNSTPIAHAMNYIF